MSAASGDIRLPGTSAPEADWAPEHAPARLPGESGFLATVGDIGAFFVAALRGLRHVGPFMGEAIRQAAIIATGSTLVILAITFLAGGSCGLESSALARAFGTAPVVPPSTPTDAR